MGLLDEEGAGWPVGWGGSNTLDTRPEPTMQAYNPSWRERLAAWAMGDQRPAPARERFVSGLLGTTGLPGSERMSVVDAVPGANIPFLVNEAARAKSQGDLGGLAAASIGLLPGAGPAAREATMGATSAARGIIGQGTRGMAAVRSLRELPYEEAMAVARAEPHLIQNAEGQFVGAPRGVRTREDLMRLRANFDAQTERGIGGADWYENGKLFNREIAGADPKRQALAAQEEALWSAQADPNTNLGFALQGHNAYERGFPAEQVRTGQQAQTYNAARDAGVAVPLGAKTGVYGKNLDPTIPDATTGTNDIWHARAWGFVDDNGRPWSKALTPQQHSFLDYETMLAADRANQRRLLGRSDWTGPEIQAAPWVAGKGESLAERYPGRFPTNEAGIVEASKGYPEYSPKYTAYATSEQIPGNVTGLRVPAGQGDEFSRAAMWKDPTGRDPIYGDMGFWTRRSTEGPGRFENAAGVVENNLGQVARPLVDYQMTDAGKVVHPGTVTALNAGEATRGLLDAQEGSAWNKIIPGGAGAQSSAQISAGRPLTVEELNRVAEIQKKHGFEALGNTDEGAALMSWGDKGLTAKQLNAIQADVEKAIPGAKVERGALNSGYVDYSGQLAKENAGQGQATKAYLEGQLPALKEQAPAMYERLMQSQAIAEKAGANLERLQKFGMLGQRPDYEELLKVIREGKLKGLAERVKGPLGYTGLPAIAGAAALPGLLEAPKDERRRPGA